jgi:RNA polymerase sigma-70 factor (ECF subfamily)
MASLLRDGVTAGSPDRDLLERFATNPDRGGELAFTALVARHGPMVLGVCRRILRDPSEADDAFQATFLVLARKAGSIRLGESLGPWLRGLSTKVARRLQIVATRRHERFGGGGWLESIPDWHRGRRGDLDRTLDLDETLEAVPATFRSALRLCYLDGLTHAEAATRLGCPVGTVRSRLARGRAILRRRLEATPAIAANHPDAGWIVPALAPSLIASTARAAARLAAGSPMAGIVPARVTEVATGVIAAMSGTKIVVALMVALGSLAGWGAWAGQTLPRTVVDAPSPSVERRPSVIGPDRAILLAQREVAQPPTEKPTASGSHLRSDGQTAKGRPQSHPRTSPPSSSRRHPSWEMLTSIRPRPKRSG